MSHVQFSLLNVCLVLLILLTAFFSFAETGLMAINRYRLRHRARLKKKSAILILRLLKRPDRLLAVVLIGSCFANVLASSIATLLSIHYFGEKTALLAAVFLTFILLIFAEVAPKTLAALYPERISKWVVWPLFLLLKISYPLVWIINFITNNMLRLFGVHVAAHKAEPLSREELRSVVYETSGRLSRHYQNMLLGILDLNKVAVSDVMVPQHEIVGIDLEQEWEVIQLSLAKMTYDWVPMYREHINNVVGMLHVRELMLMLLKQQAMDKDVLIKLGHEPYFVPDSTPLNMQLLHFQRQNKRTALVVDEYGEIQGLLTLADILEEIVGEFATDSGHNTKIIQIQKDGSYLIDGAMSLREFHRVTQWDLPVRGQRTINGLILEYLESIPRAGTCIKINDYPIEIVHVQENRVKVARIFPQLKRGT